MKLIVDRFFSLNTVYFVGFNFCGPWKLGSTVWDFHVGQQVSREASAVVQLWHLFRTTEAIQYTLGWQVALSKIREHGSFLCHFHINCCLPISYDMLSRPIVRPPVNEKFISVFLKHYGLVCFPITIGFRGFSIYPVIKQQREIGYFTINAWLSCCVWGEPFTRNCDCIVWDGTWKNVRNATIYGVQEWGLGSPSVFAPVATTYYKSVAT
jgi:hypothetical protein